MKYANAQGLAVKRGFRSDTVLRNGMVHLEIMTSDGPFSLPVSGDNTVNGDIVTVILQQLKPPKGLDSPVKRG